jgi:hypothetical protein
MKRTFTIIGYSLLDNSDRYWTTDDVHALERNLTEEQAWLVLVIAKLSDDSITSDLLDDIILTYVLPNLKG